MHTFLNLFLCNLSFNPTVHFAVNASVQFLCQMLTKQPLKHTRRLLKPFNSSFLMSTWDRRSCAKIRTYLIIKEI